MKKFFVMLTVGLMSFSAFAQEEVTQENSQDLSQEEMTYATPGEIIGGVIGGVIGGINAGRGGGWGPGRGHGPGRGPGRPQAYVCYARNLRGQTFQANDWDSGRAQRQAMNECLRNSQRCQPAGCQRY